MEEWGERDRINLTETLNSLEGARGMEEEKYVSLHYLVPTSFMDGTFAESRRSERTIHKLFNYGKNKF